MNTNRMRPCGMLPEFGSHAAGAIFIKGQEPVNPKLCSSAALKKAADTLYLSISTILTSFTLVPVAPVIINPSQAFSAA